MSEKEYAKGIYIKKFTGKYGDWLSVSIKEGETYKNYKFYPKKEQKSDKYIEFYGVVDTWKPDNKDGSIVKFGDDPIIGEEEIPFS
jgi:hypothetical protein